MLRAFEHYVVYNFRDQVGSLGSMGRFATDFNFLFHCRAMVLCLEVGYGD